MPARGTNAVVKIACGVAYVEVGTRKYPDATARIDVADLPLVLDGRGRWCAWAGKTTLYVIRGSGPRNKRRYTLLHRHLLGLTSPKDQGDHRNGNGLDNCRDNIRAATHAQNCRNSRRRRDGTSNYRGVSWDRERQKWIASIRRADGRGRQHLGRFVTEIAAAKAYDAAAAKRYGEFARLNFPRRKSRG